MPRVGKDNDQPIPGQLTAAVDRLLKEISGPKTLLLAALKKFLPEEFLRAVAAVREPEVVPYLYFLDDVKRELAKRKL